jgi:hypothetical protein
MARTAFHRKAFLNVGNLDELKLSVTQAKEEILLNFTQQIQTAQSALSGRFDNINATLSIHTDKIDQIPSSIVNAKNEIIEAIPGRIEPTDVTPEAFVCVRALSQVQDLVTDKDKSCDQNNKALDKLTKSPPFSEASKLLEKSDLVQRFQAAFRNFTTGEFKELAERFVEIQDLNSDLVRYFASKTK